MIDSLTPYTAYKDSGLPWLGQVPEHWEVRPAFGVFKPNRDRNTGMIEKTVLSLSYGRIIIKPAEKLHGLVPESFETYQIIQPGDIIIRTTDLQNDHTSLRVGIAREKGIITSAYLALRTQTGVNPEYGYRFLDVWDSSKAIYGFGSGLRQSLDFSHFKRMPIPLPPPAEQAAIVRFLEWAGGRLERTIRAKRKQLQLMRERAVVETENSIHSNDVVWKRLSNISHQMHRLVERQKNQKYTRIGLYNRGRGIFHKPTVTGSELGDSEFFYVSEGDFVISGQFAWEGAVALARNKEAGCIASHRYPILRGTESIVLSSFLFSFFRSSYGLMLLNIHSRGAAGRNRPLNAERLLREYVPVPSLHAQHNIQEILEEEFALTDIIEREIELLREYRTRLIADVVTGKLDVRAAAATLPDDAAFDQLAEDATDTSDDDSDSLEDVDGDN